jgi:hypothetical protein
VYHGAPTGIGLRNLPEAIERPRVNRASVGRLGAPGGAAHGGSKRKTCFGGEGAGAPCGIFQMHEAPPGLPGRRRNPSDNKGTSTQPRASHLSPGLRNSCIADQAVGGRWWSAVGSVPLHSGRPVGLMSGIAQTTIKICNDPEIQTKQTRNTSNYNTNTTQNKLGPARRASRVWRV